MEERHSRNRKNVENVEKIYRKHMLESLTPGILVPSSPTKLEKNLICLTLKPVLSILHLVNCELVPL